MPRGTGSWRRRGDNDTFVGSRLRDTFWDTLRCPLSVNWADGFTWE